MQKYLLVEEKQKTTVILTEKQQHEREDFPEREKDF